MSKNPGGGWRRRPEDTARKIVMVGLGNIADVAFQFFLHDSPHEVVAFSVEKAFIEEDRKFGLPIVAFESVQEEYNPRDYAMFVAVGYGSLNHLRARFYRRAKEKGYRLVSYVSSRATVWHDAEMGENCFILEENVIQPFVKIGNNVMLWSGNHIGHGVTIRDHAYLASHVVVSGFVEIGEYCFVGVNATLADSVKVGNNCLIGAGALVSRSVDEFKVVRARPGKPEEFSILSEAARETFWPAEDPS